ncbi:hypothetical protein C8R44DRAFT_884883 [Mycena epipterygia]|nr:hypothetical protein C8R44DRAFT_884883 [Mycena epipterygia]
MPPKRKKQPDSDADYRGPPAAKRGRQEIQEDMFFQTSSAPTSPNPGRDQSLEESDGEDGFSDNSDDAMAPLPAFMTKLVGLPTGEPSTSAACNSTPRRNGRRAVSESPVHIPSPATSTVFDASPAKPRGGCPRVKNPQRHSRSFYSNMTSESRETLRSSARALTKANTAERRKKLVADAAETRRKEAEAVVVAKDARKRAKAQEYLEKLTTAEEEGGAGFTSAMDWLDTLLLPGGDAASLFKMLSSIS